MLKIFEKARHRAMDYLATLPFPKNFFQNTQKTIFLVKIGKVQIHFSRFQGTSTQILLKIKVHYPRDIWLDYPFVITNLWGAGSGINREINPLHITQIFSL